jgi:GNAT superfamily N-acetyltransferase
MGGETTELIPGVRPLGVADLEGVIAIDQAHTGRARRRFFEQRFGAAQLSGAEFSPVGVDSDGVLIGFACARILQGEFGREEPVVELDAVGVDPRSQGHGFGRTLLRGLAKVMRDRGVRELHSQADWTNHELLQFFDSAGFELAPRISLERSVGEPLAEPIEEP